MFDLRTHIRDPKTGALTTYQPYSKRITKDGTFYERPPRSGNLFFENGEPAGRLVAGKLNKELSHIEIAPVLSERETLIDLNAEQAHKIAELEAKLIAQEAEQKMGQAEPETKPEAVAETKTAPAKAAQPNKK